jgi:L-ascorbate metabolism protein UlaG (beta-lactamase superfamily)
MKIKYIGHSCFLFTAEDGTTVLSDPYKPGAYGGGITYLPVRDETDMVFVTHDHEDHDDIKGLINQPLHIRTGCSARGIGFDTIDTFHDNEQGKKRGPNKIFTFTMDTINVAHAGDLGHLLSDEQVQAVGSVDILLLPVGGHFTVDPQEAKTVMEQIKPKICIPMHFKTVKCAFPIETAEPFLQGGYPVRRSASSEVILVKDDLPESCSILYLPPSN